ncbi:hypothetical protein DEU56DRAFT_166966 [Suillus clintonianus]|uniref:uncharacterized protein n=1 Tax=Suillus clintonianus TaxID=1904413 RepID=UPI001B886D2D|nr:uncharacterized protein DEU56DRAFT_166966 [Suillus clintonianus]KAG2146211.1 hypothetical protein DEU56DRAFT_166966 [Suillus clintonianus]
MISRAVKMYLLRRIVHIHQSDPSLSVPLKTSSLEPYANDIVDRTPSCMSQKSKTRVQRPTLCVLLFLFRFFIILTQRRYHATKNKLFDLNNSSTPRSSTTTLSNLSLQQLPEPATATTSGMPAVAGTAVADGMNSHPNTTRQVGWWTSFVFRVCCVPIHCRQYIDGHH